MAEPSLGASFLTVKAAVFEGAQPRQLAIREFRVPDTAPQHGMLLRTEIAAVCGSDVHMYQRGWNRRLVIPGHEIVGRVERVDPDFRDAAGKPLSIGDRVALESTIPCGVCRYCRGIGSRPGKVVDYGYCDDYLLWGAVELGDPVWLSGGWAQYVQVPRRALAHRLSPDLPLNEAVLLEPMAVSVHAVRTAGIGLGDVVVVEGPGPIGLLALVAAKAAGASKVYLTGARGDESRLQASLLLGADGIIDVSGGDVVAQLLRLTGGVKADRVIDATGHVAGVMLGIELAARGGIYVGLGGEPPSAEASIRPDYLLRNKIDLRFSHLGSGCYEAARGLIEARRYPLGILVSHTCDIDHAEQAVQIMAERRDGCIKSAILFDSN